MVEDEGGERKGRGMRIAVLTGILALLSPVSVNAVPAQQAYSNPLCKAGIVYVVPSDPDVLRNLVLWTSLFESMTTDLIEGGLNVAYAEKLRTMDAAGEAAIPGLHAAMIQAALPPARAQVRTGLVRLAANAKGTLASRITRHQLTRLAYLFGPLVRCNEAVRIGFTSGDTAADAAWRSLSDLREDDGYRLRLRQVSSESDMAAALAAIDPIAANYRSGLRVVGEEAVRAGIHAAKIKANAMAAEHGFKPFYP